MSTYITREQGDEIARDEIQNGLRESGDPRQRCLLLDRVVGDFVETHISDWQSRLKDAKEGLGPYPLPVGHIKFYPNGFLDDIDL